jgi:hypothetical protein
MRVYILTARRAILAAHPVILIALRAVSTIHIFIRLFTLAS